MCYSASSLQEENQPTFYVGVNITSLSQFTKACSEYGPNSLFCIEFLKNWSEGKHWTPQEFHIIVKTFLNAYEYMQCSCGSLINLKSSPSTS